MIDLSSNSNLPQSINIIEDDQANVTNNPVETAVTQATQDNSGEKNDSSIQPQPLQPPGEGLEKLRRKLAQVAKLVRVTPAIGDGNALEVWDKDKRVSLGRYDAHDAAIHKNRRAPLYV
jgi:hypothetical protein